MVPIGMAGTKKHFVLKSLHGLSNVKILATQDGRLHKHDHHIDPNTTHYIDPYDTHMDKKNRQYAMITHTVYEQPCLRHNYYAL